MSRYLKIVLLISLVSSVAFSCKSKKRQEPIATDYKAEMIAADREFSKLSEEKGMRFALLQYIDSNGVLLRPDAAPLVGGNAINFISQGNDTAYKMTWEPSGGTVAISGELGYTFGIYSLKPNNKDTVYYGTYISVWKRQPDGKWKFALETGNEGIE
jgi:ketosteroid isomerase-like protein